MKIYTDLENFPRHEDSVLATVDADTLLDLGAHDCMVEVLDLMTAIEKESKKPGDRWTVLGSQIGTALMRLELSLNDRLRKAAAEGEARQPT